MGTCFCLLLHNVLVSDNIDIEVLDKGVVTPRLVPEHRQQLKQGRNLVSVIVNEIDVALGKTPCLQ